MAGDVYTNRGLGNFKLIFQFHKLNGDCDQPRHEKSENLRYYKFEIGIFAPVASSNFCQATQQLEMESEQEMELQLEEEEEEEAEQREQQLKRGGGGAGDA